VSETCTNCALSGDWNLQDCKMTDWKMTDWKMTD